MFKTTVSTLQLLGNCRFIVPSYQRPYVWGEEQINKLLDDFNASYHRSDNNYFIGTVLTSEQNGISELIDGQQRFTTLWLIALSFQLKGINTKLNRYLKVNDDLRFDFAIRKQVKEYLQNMLHPVVATKQYTNEEAESDDYLVNIARALTTIANKSFKFDRGESMEGLGDFIYEKVQFVINTAPPKTNLNKLFTTINSSGVQLEQSDILKSQLLKLIQADSNHSERLLYSKVWEACENMNSFFERNVRKIFTDTNWNEVDAITFEKLAPAIFKYKDEGTKNSLSTSVSGYSLQQILANGVVYEKADIDKMLKESEGNDDDSDRVYCRSIISFPQLLLHAFRIYLYENNRPDFEQPFHSKHLIEIFRQMNHEPENTRSEFVKGFLASLWTTRYLFDKYIVKWVKRGEDKEEELKITTIAVADEGNNRFFNRVQPERNNAASMLQSVLYFTSNRNTQIWLTPYLYRLKNGEDPVACLESIDNWLSLSKQEDKTATYNLMDSKYSVSDMFDLETYLNESNGTSFRHYWFQKLEYVLWKDWDNKNDIKYQQYRITSKNSVEHVFPQNEEYKRELESKYLNSFGNLALLNVSQNSSYSNQKVAKKRIDFKEKPVYDSLKLAMIYNNPTSENWGADDIEEHKVQMIEKLKKHYINCINGDTNQ